MSISMSSMSTSGTPTTTMSGMMMATSMPSSSGSTMMGMDSMGMVFFAATNTPLYSWAWTPNSTGQYAGTCIFLIVLAAVFRALIAIRVRSDAFFHADACREKGGPYEGIENQGQGGTAPLPHRRWTASAAVILAGMDLVLAGVSYLLMLAVMTMNVGYFLSILGGVFLGSLLFGHFTHGYASH